MAIQTYRIYDPEAPPIGVRVLVDRLWPRGIRSADPRIDEWMKEVAPSNQLRRWYQHDPQKWPEFKRRYFNELDEHPEIVHSLGKLAQSSDLVLLFGSRERVLNNASALKEYLEGKLPKIQVTAAMRTVNPQSGIRRKRNGDRK